MPLSNKTILDNHCFVHELKTEMHDDLEYVKSIKKEIDELESEKADFSNIYDLLLEECVSKDVICSYLHSLSDLNAHTELKCMYLHKVKECECLAQKLSKQTESVNNEVHNKLLKSFAKLEKHSISLELSLQHCKEQMENNPVCKENASNVFRKEREQYHEIQDLKAQMQDKNMVINELKKLSLINLYTKQSVNKTNVSDGLFKQVTQQNLPQIRKQAVQNTNVIAPGPSRNNPKHVEAKKSAQLQKDIRSEWKPRWNLIGVEFKTIGLRWVPTGKIFAFSTNKVDSEPPNGSKEDITNQCESEQALDVSAGTLLEDQSRGLHATDIEQRMSRIVLYRMTSDHNRSEHRNSRP
ncbi:hypothetical protein Tco_0400927 [Tanacetum coccineum]